MQRHVEDVSIAKRRARRDQRRQQEKSQYDDRNGVREQVGLDASEFLKSMPAERIRYFHLAGHYVEAEDLRIDTHGTPVDDQAWRLLEEAYSLFGPVPTLLERDFNFPPMQELLDEVRRIKQLQTRTENRRVANA